MDVPSNPAPPSDFGDFAVQSLIGAGGSGAVYAAERRGAEVALKVLRPDLALSEKETRAFLAEAERMRKVTHPSLIHVIEAGTLPDGRPYLAMPRLHGESLADRLARGPIPPLSALALFDGLAGAVGALHAAGLVHRDIKPENIFALEGEERLVLLDLGIAREIDAPASTTTQAGMVRGTPAYMAPERFFGSQASVGTDVYELAVVLYMMLVGRLPWDSVHDARGRMFPRRPEDAGIAVPPALSAAVLDALSTNADLRPRSAEAFAERVRRSIAEPAGASVPTLKVAAGAPPPGAAARSAPPPAERSLDLQPTAAATPFGKAATRPPGRRRAVVPALLAAVAAAALLFSIGRFSPRAALLSGPPAADAGAADPLASASAASLPDDEPSAELPAQATPAPSATAVRPRPPPTEVKTAAPSPPGPSAAASSSAAPGGDLPQCRRLVGLYCSPAFKATDSGAQCSVWSANLERFRKLPPQAIGAMDEGCRPAYDAGMLVLKERQRQMDAGVHP